MPGPSAPGHQTLTAKLALALAWPPSEARGCKNAAPYGGAQADHYCTLADSTIHYGIISQI